MPNYLSLHGHSGSASGSPILSATMGNGGGGNGNGSGSGNGGSSEWEDDFVMLCEFSELYGAVEIWHVPEKAELTGFDRGKFLASIMSVDYQSGHEAGDTFREDTSVAVVDPNSRHTYYAYHFTLLDIHARGYVRPLAFVYVTRSTTVVMGHHKELSELFSETVKVLKQYNWVLTNRDIKRCIADLDYTLAELKSGNASFSEGFSEGKLTGLRDRLRDLVKLKFKLDGLGNAATAPAVPKEYLPPIEEVFPPELLPYIPVLCTEEHKRHFDRNLRTVEELCGGHPVNLAKYMLARIISRFFQSPPTMAEREMAEAAAAVEPLPAEELDLCIGGAVTINYGVLRKKDDGRGKMMDTSKFRRRRARASAKMPEPPPPLQTSEGAAESAAKMRDSGVRSPLLVSHKPIIDEGDHSGNAACGEVARNGEAERKGDAHGEESPYPPLKIGTCMMDEEPPRMWFYHEMIPGVGGSPGLHEFIRGHSFSQALVYSLLRGRPVVVRARPEKRALVEQYVSLLSVFVAGMEGCVVSWRDTPLRLADLARLRLVGVPRRSSILPKAVERCVTVLNVDSIPETLVAPECPPDAEYVNRILALDKCWPDEENYYAHVRQELYNVGLWSSLYYNMCCVGTLKMTNNNVDKKEEERDDEKEDENEEEVIDEEIIRKERTKAIEEALAAAEAGAPSQKAMYATAPLPLDVRESFKDQFCTDAKISRSDLAILENFAEVIKLQQAMAEPGAFLHVLPVRIVEAQSLIFKNTVK